MTLRLAWSGDSGHDDAAPRTVMHLLVERAGVAQFDEYHFSPNRLLGGIWRDPRGYE
jgi:hypothetical protein